jgi:hypothetical protein
VEIVGTVMGSETTNKFVNYRVEDGTGAVSCLLWNAKEQPVSNIKVESIGFGKTVLARGKIALFDDVRQIILSQILPLESPIQEAFWITQTIVLQKTVYLQNSAPQSARKFFAIEDLGLEHQFEKKNVVQALNNLGLSPDCVDEMLSRWISLDHVYMAPELAYRKLPDEKLTRVLSQELKKLRNGVHYRFMWNRLKTMGYTISSKAVHKCLELCANENHGTIIRVGSTDVYKYQPR